MDDIYKNYRELTLRGTVLGALITVIFTASNVYLGLKVGLTFASSIPAAVLSMAILKRFTGSNILENNMVQTQASAAGTLSAIIFVIPGMLMLGYWQGFPFWQTMLICATGGILGVIFTVPLRRVMVVNSDLPYPEGVAAAEILKVSDGANDGLKHIAAGASAAGILSFLTSGLRVVADGASYWFKVGGAAFQLPMGFSVALLGAGYLVGIVGGLAILLGTIFTWGVAVPILTSMTDTVANSDFIAEATNIWRTKVRFIGVGLIGIAAIWTLISLFKPMLKGMEQSIEAFKKSKVNGAAANRTDLDLSPIAMIAIVSVAVVFIAMILNSFISPVEFASSARILLVAVCTVLAVAIGFFVAAACGYMAGLVGSSSSPISGIGIISVVVISLILMLIGNLTGLTQDAVGVKFLTALTIYTASIVLAVATISNDNLQDLKTGYLVHATPWKQQIALLIGCVVGALVIAPVLELLYNAYGFTGAMPREGMDVGKALSAPQATLMTTIANGIFSHNLEWTYILIGVVLGVIIIVFDQALKTRTQNRYSLPALAVGMGIYLPPAISMPLIIGAVIAWLLQCKIKKDSNNSKEALAAAENRATLFSAGLIVGESLVGVIMAFIIAASVTSGHSDAPLAISIENWDNKAEFLGWFGFIFITIMFARRILKK